MSCAACQKSRESGVTFPYRIGNGNIELRGCREHVQQAMDVLREHQSLTEVVSYGSYDAADPGERQTVSIMVNEKILLGRFDTNNYVDIRKLTISNWDVIGRMPLLLRIGDTLSISVEKTAP